MLILHQTSGFENLPIYFYHPQHESMESVASDAKIGLVSVSVIQCFPGCVIKRLSVQVSARRCLSRSTREILQTHI